MTKMKFLYCLYILEVILILPMLGDNKNQLFLDIQIFHNFVITVIFGFNCVVNFYYCILKYNKQRIDYIGIALLFSVILFLPINNIIIAIK